MRGCLTIYVHTQTAVEEPGGVSPELVHLQLFPDVQGLGWGVWYHGFIVIFPSRLRPSHLVKLSEKETCSDMILS